MPDNQKPGCNQQLHLLLNTDEELDPEMNQLIMLAKENGYGVQEVKKVLPSRLMKGLRHFFLGEERRDPRVFKGGAPCKIPNCRKHVFKPLPRKGFGRRPITDTLMLRKKQRIRRQRQMEKKKKNKQFRIFGITFGGARG
ncbi:unnamed protein product [Nezara viridula]|uniref:Uncharacterized protein n=1 Tax=Nezara viridula TaxID=85310 RepID=A0A9P0HQE1_NEZVI|nr:unnamed protein product [Nezara viridula]